MNHKHQWHKKRKGRKSRRHKKRRYGDSFYHSTEWKRLRYRALVKNGGMCEACGATAKSGRQMNVDHIVPISKAWERRLDETNLQVLCASCNEGKYNLDQTDWRAKPYWPEGSEGDIAALRMGLDYALAHVR